MLYSDIIGSHVTITGFYCSLSFFWSDTSFFKVDIFKGFIGIVYKVFIIVYKILHLVVWESSSSILFYKLPSENCIYFYKLFISFLYGRVWKRLRSQSWYIFKFIYFYSCIYFKDISEISLTCICSKNAWKENRARYNKSNYFLHNRGE